MILSCNYSASQPEFSGHYSITKLEISFRPGSLVPLHGVLNECHDHLHTSSKYSATQGSHTIQTNGHESSQSPAPSAFPPRSKKKNPSVRKSGRRDRLECMISIASHYQLFFRLRPIRPKRPEPSSQTAAGTGTGAVTSPPENGTAL